jgi:excisionase family DNA binding protein
LTNLLLSVTLCNVPTEIVTIQVQTPDLLSITEAAKALGKKRMQVYRWIKSGKLIALRLGDRQYIPKSEVERVSNETANPQ